jgi:hypothetical protein
VGAPQFDATQTTDCPLCQECDAIDSCARIPDTCLIGGTCFNVGEDNPANECETCGPADPNGWTVKADGTACGDSNETGCDLADECLQGVCDPNLEPADTECGSPQTGECDAQDTCDGLGSCLDNFADQGTACLGCYACDGSGNCDTNQIAVDFSPCNNPDSSCEGYCYTGICAVEGYCNRPVGGCDVLQVYGDQEGETLECRLPEDVVGLTVEVGLTSGEAGEFVPVRVYLENRWSGPLFDLYLVLELDSSGLAYVRRSALLDGGIRPIDENVSELQMEAVFNLGGVEGFPAGRSVLDLMLVRSAGGDQSFGIKAWLPCDSALEEVGCHTQLSGHLARDGGRGGSQRVSGANVVVRGAKYEEDDERVRMMASPTLGCACGTGGGRGPGLLILGLVILVASRRKFTNLQ